MVDTLNEEEEKKSLDQLIRDHLNEACNELLTAGIS